MYILYRLTKTVTQNMRKTSSNCMVKEVQPSFACRRVKISHCNCLCDRLKCPYDQIFDFHFFTFSCTIRPSYSSCQISIHYEHQKSFYFNIYFREFTAAINQPCSKAWLQMGESDVKDSNIPHGLKL